MALCAGGLYHITVLDKLANMLLKSAGATSEGHSKHSMFALHSCLLQFARALSKLSSM